MAFSLSLSLLLSRFYDSEYGFLPLRMKIPSKRGKRRGFPEAWHCYSSVFGHIRFSEVYYFDVSGRVTSTYKV